MIGPRPAALLGPAPRLAEPRVRLFLTSAALLFVELFLIRWIPANVIYIGFFTNIILIGSFLGIGADRDLAILSPLVDTAIAEP